MIFSRNPGNKSDQEKQEKIESMYEGAKRNFPDVPEMTVEQVQERQAAGEDVVLVDVRTPEEQETSMIPGAITREQFEADPSKHEGKPVVCYCTIGGRSGQYAQQLREQGVDAYNMPGAVLAWSHTGGELVNAEGKTNKVHTHSAKFNLVAGGYEGVW